MHRDWGAIDPAWAGIRSEIVDLAGNPVHVLRADGPTDGPVQLLVHGLGGAAVNWLEVIGPLSSRGPVIAPDLPGFGRTQPPRSRASRVDHNVAFLRALIRNQGFTRVEVHGNSMGGLLTTLLAADVPEFIDRLILVDPALVGTASRIVDLDPMTLRTFAPFAVPRVGERVFARWYRDRSAEQLVDDNATFVHADPTRIRPVLRRVLIDNATYGKANPWRVEGFSAAASSVLRTLANPRTIHQALDGLEPPTLLVWGELDRLVGRPMVDAVLARRADVDVVVLDGVGHAPMMETPERYLEVVVDWLTSPTSEVA